VLLMLHTRRSALPRCAAAPRPPQASVQGQHKGAPWLGGSPVAARVQSLSRVEICGAAVPPGYSTGRVVTVYRRIPTCPPAASLPCTRV
jgi:hypothetical protein